MVNQKMKGTRQRAEMLKCTYRSNLKVESTPAVDIGILPNPKFQSTFERLRDEPNLQMLQKLQKLVETRGIDNYEDLKKAKEEVLEVQGIVDYLKSEERSTPEVKKEIKKEMNLDIKEEVIEPIVENPTRGRKAPEKMMIPRWVRRSARRRSNVNGEAWTEELYML